VATGIGKAKKSKAGIGALDESKAIQTSMKQNIDKFAKDQYGFVSPSLEALLKSAPPNLKGKQITEWLAANANKGVKPKELEYLGIDEFVAANPKATINQVVEGVGDNKVVVGKNVYKGDSYGQAGIEFEVTTPELDPLDGSPLHQFETENLLYAVRSGDEYEIANIIADFNTANPQAKVKSIDDIENFLKTKGEDFEDFIDNVAKARYQDNPYELVKPVQTQGAVGALDDHFAFGNDEVGYQIFIGGQRATDPDNIAYSRAEAQIQLQTKLENDNLLDIVETGARYKQYVDETLPGGDNYREVVFTWQNAPVEHGVQDHFQEMNQISSALIRNRKLADGKKTLHVDELQSDLHTKGSKHGYIGSEKLQKTTEEISLLNKKLIDDAAKTKQKYEELIPKMSSSSEYQLRLQKGLDEQFDDFIKAEPGEKVIQAGYIQDFNRNYLQGLPDIDPAKDLMIDSNKLNDLVASANSAVPNYPFKDDWYAMSLKQLLKDAIDEGADAISVSGSAPIKARYTDEYSKFYETLYDQKIPSAMKKLANKYGGKFEKGNLDEYDIYGSLLDDVRKGNPDAIDNVLGLYGERFGGGVQDIDEVLENINKLAETNIIRITPKMKAKILEEGLPSFAFGGPVFKPFSIDNIDIFNP
jgi:hypothetical protein